MKNIARILFLSTLFFFQGSYSKAQILSKDGRPVLPERGEWGLGIDLTRMVSLGGMRVSSSAPLFTAKYMLDSARAFRLGVRVSVDNSTVRNRTEDRAAAAGSVQAYPAAMQMKDNIWKHTKWQLMLSGGAEKRKGHRLQGLYGWEIMVLLGETSDKFTYGNALNASPLSHITVDPSGDAMSSPELGNANNIDSLPAIQGVSGSARVTERKGGLTIGAGVRLFVGAEYFFLPKMSVGAELGWGAAYVSSGRSKVTLESEGNSTSSGSAGPDVQKTTIDGGTSGRLSLDHDAVNPAAGLSASLRLLLYF